MAKSLVDSVDELSKRFDWFSDSLLCRVTIEYASSGHASVTITVNARDAANDPVRWSIVVVKCSKVSEYRVTQQKNTTNSVLCFGVCLSLFSQDIGLDLSGAVEPVVAIEELRRSDFYVICRECTWEVNDATNITTLSINSM